jgi:hypothetical protein
MKITMKSVNSYHNQKIRRHNFSAGVFAFFAGGVFLACILAAFLAFFPLRLDDFFPVPPPGLGLANSAAAAADSSESESSNATAL